MRIIWTLLYPKNCYYDTTSTSYIDDDTMMMLTLDVYDDDYFWTMI